MSVSILGIDASSVSIGWCLITDGTAVQHGTIKLRDKDIALRCWAAGYELQQLLGQMDADHLAIEGPALATRPLALSQQARVAGVILALAAQRGLVPVIEIAPASAKKVLTGSGRADKDLMMQFAGGQLSGPFDEHAADALAVALTAYQQLLSPVVKSRSRPRRRSA